MTRIELDNLTLGRLLGTAAECVDVCHPGGYVVGSFSPGLTWEHVLRSAPPPLTEEERNARLNGKTYTWAEVMEHLWLMGLIRCWARSRTVLGRTPRRPA
jgi:hypothetical protein